MVSDIATPTGNRIRSLRQSRGWAQKRLAHEAGVPRPWLSLVETGDIEIPGSDRLNDVAKALGVDSDYLLTGEQLDGVTLTVAPDEVEDVSQFRQLPRWARQIGLAAGKAAKGMSPVGYEPADPVRDDSEQEGGQKPAE